MKKISLKKQKWHHSKMLLGLFSIFLFSCSDTDSEFYEEIELNNALTSINASAIITILNPGFEDDKSKWGSHSRYSISTDEHSGSKAAKVSNSSGRIQQTVTVTKNTDYVLKAWVKGNGKLTIGNATNDFNTNNYTQISVNFNSGNTESATITGTRDSGDVRFDDFTLESSGSTDGGNDGNLALGRPTSQSSTGFGGSSSRAVDGNTSGNWTQGSVTHTNKTNRPWWEVNLGSNQNVEQIKIWNRTNCCSNRLNNFDVLVYNTNGNEVFKRTITSTPNPSVTINTGGVNGSRVRVRLNGTEFLSLAEVQVFGEPGNDDSGGNDDDNLARGKQATQSSTGFGGSASRAVDGNTSGDWTQGSVTHTNKTNRPWWEVNLGSNQNVEQIKIWNRTNCCSNRLNNFDVLVYNTNGNEVFKRTITSTPNPSVTINTGAINGSRVRVRLNGTEFLSLAEVQVFGEPGDDDSGGNDDGGQGSGSAAAIIGGMNSIWKLNGFSGSLNVGSGSYGRDGSNGLDYEDRASISDNNNWFFDTNGYAAFKCHVGNPTSSGSGNMRSELRELSNGNEIDWDGTTNTTHRMRYKVQVRQLPSSGKICFGQIHGQGVFDDVIRVQLEDTSVTENDRQNDTSGAGSGTYDVKIKGYVTETLDRDNRNKTWATMQMDKEYDLEITMRDEKVTVYLDGVDIYTSKDVNSKDNFFKAGAYLQSAQSDKSPQLRRHVNNFGEVWIKNISVSH